MTSARLVRPCLSELVDSILFRCRHAAFVAAVILAIVAMLIPVSTAEEFFKFDAVSSDSRAIGGSSEVELQVIEPTPFVSHRSAEDASDTCGDGDSGNKINERMSMITLFVAGILTKLTSQLVSSHQVWAVAV
mmetsp:Transcript_71742/g.126641  ORF Transcript_71742/g.126641 Transcript_71742/m.126641 type:complete len:133 (-) Transcript_71742:186-584(-)|eukprot:CAMPEP_0197659840 /NCGR_PEP_ID=MMETSP1338-20131121/49337_1 /TAXON_ID=43686 ORGANISM="Pelagodinium beii, Strain RCC1491" /NCGR_SAMPLE_ID=MMETSP1338 /ASSEMBLY_ACC=CAM_ASM_000754 /LENGTH=132 /DNA_ID=CAMNT_0043236967 /DNA_START=121 /DNA_END=519 /DNA_ORIENTATION=+